MADLKVALEELKQESDSGAVVLAVSVTPKSRRRTLAWAVGIVVLLVLVAAGLWLSRSRAKSTMKASSSITRIVSVGFSDFTPVCHYARHDFVAPNLYREKTYNLQLRNGIGVYKLPFCRY
jgi:hypothetical protein